MTPQQLDTLVDNLRRSLVAPATLALIGAVGLLRGAAELMTPDTDTEELLDAAAYEAFCAEEG